MTRLGDSDAAYVAAVLVLLCGLPDTPLRPSPADQTLARRLYQDAVSLPLVESSRPRPTASASHFSIRLVFGSES